MPRHLIRALASTAPKAIQAGGPGSNGFLRREQWFRPGTFTWTALKTGKVKVQAIGAASGNNGQRAGTSGGYGEKTFDVVQGQQYTIVVGQGGSGSSGASRSTAGGTTSISGPGLAQALVIPGAVGALAGEVPSISTAPIGSGPWDRTYRGAHAHIDGTGGPASASPFGDGFASSGTGGAGWGGGTTGDGGGGTHGPGSIVSGGPGLTIFATGPTAGGVEIARPIWDLSDADAPGGSSRAIGGNTSTTYASNTPVGSGAAFGAGGQRIAYHSALGGGSSFNDAQANSQRAGNGAGGPASGSQNSAPSAGGHGFVQLFWDEVT